MGKFNGDGYVSYNRGRKPREGNGGWPYQWQKTDKPVKQGNHARTCMFYLDLDGKQRADMHSLQGTFTNEAETWFHLDCGLKDPTGDDTLPEGTNPYDSFQDLDEDTDNILAFCGPQYVLGVLLKMMKDGTEHYGDIIDA